MRKLFFVLPLVLASIVSVFATTLPCSPYDILQLGDSASETNHKAEGFGTPEPTTHGGNWGNILAEPSPSDQIAKVVWENGAADHFEERGAKFTMKIPTSCGLCRIKANHLNIRWLDGIANDDYIVFWEDPVSKQWVLMDVVVSDPSTAEVWKTEEIKLNSIPERLRKAGKTLTFKIVSTASAWQYHSTYGQVGIDYITLDN